MTRTCHYPSARLRADYAGAAGGMLVCALIVLSAGVSSRVSVVAGLLFVLFACFAAQTFNRQRLRIALDDDGLRVLPRGAKIAWRELQALKLAYFSTRRGSGDGWMQLTLRGPSATLRVDSRLDGFEQVVALAVEAAHEASLMLSDVTMSNIAALGLDDGAPHGPGPSMRGAV